MIEFLKSNAGIYTLATVALVFQLVGVYLVVRDLFKHYTIAGQFAKNMNVIDTAHKELQDNSYEFVVNELTNGVDDGTAKLIEPGVRTHFLASKADLVSTDTARYLLATVAVPTRWKTWVGPLSLGLGIVLAYGATMLGVR